MENTHKRLEALLQAMPPISLAEMSEIRLMKRTDQKYLTNIDTLAELLRLTRDDYYTQGLRPSKNLTSQAYQPRQAHSRA